MVGRFAAGDQASGSRQSYASCLPRHEVGRQRSDAHELAQGVLKLGSQLIEVIGGDVLPALLVNGTQLLAAGHAREETTSEEADELEDGRVVVLGGRGEEDGVVPSDRPLHARLEFGAGRAIPRVAVMGLDA